MKLVSHSSSSPHPSGERHPFVQKGMEKFHRMHLRSPSPPHFKGKKHRRHSPPPPHHHHHRHFDHKHRRHSPLPLCSLRFEKSNLRVTPPNPSKKVRKLHHKLMKAYKLPKGAHRHYHLPPAAPEAGFFSAEAAYEHCPDCCLHYHGMSMADERPAEEGRPPHEVGVGHHGHLRRRAHPHPHKRQSCVKTEIRRGTVTPMLEDTTTPAEPPMDADAPPPSATILLADEAAPATLAAC